MNILLACLNMAAAAVIVAHGIFSVINSMSHRTGHAMRFAWVMLTMGALGVLVGPVFGRLPPGPSFTFVLAGLAVSIIVDRRRPGSLRGMP
jgi:uncharacterized membrane protein HdeD (DUF308 family)